MTTSTVCPMMKRGVPKKRAKRSAVTPKPPRTASYDDDVPGQVPHCRSFTGTRAWFVSRATRGVTGVQPARPCPQRPCDVEADTGTMVALMQGRLPVVRLALTSGQDPHPGQLVRAVNTVPAESWSEQSSIMHPSRKGDDGTTALAPSRCDRSSQPREPATHRRRRLGAPRWSAAILLSDGCPAQPSRGAARPSFVHGAAPRSGADATSCRRGTWVSW